MNRWHRHAAQIIMMGALLLRSLSVYAQQTGDETEKIYTIALYTPNTYFSSASAKIQFVEKIADYLSGKTGKKFKGRSFGSSGDLKAFIERGEVHFVIVDAIYYAGAKIGTPIGHAVGPNGSSETVSLFASSGINNVYALKGKVITSTGVGGKEINFFVNYILQGEVDPKTFFKETISATDISGAIGSVLGGKADAVFAYRSIGQKQGLKEILVGKPVSLPIFVVIKDNVSEDIITQVKSSFGGMSGMADVGITGWSGYDGGLIKTIQGMMSASSSSLSRKKLVMTKMRSQSISFEKEKFKPLGEFQLPDMKDMFIAPALKE